MVFYRNRSVLPREVGEGSFYAVPRDHRESIDTPLGLIEPKHEASPQSDKFAGFISGLAEPQQFEQSEGSQRALDFLKSQTNKNIRLFPISDPKERASGFFIPRGRNGLFNPPDRSKDRDIFLQPSAGYKTLFHEAGHARDPQLRINQAKERQFNPAFIGQISSPENRLDYLYQTTIKPRVESEVEAQAYSGFQLPRFARANPDLNIKYQEQFNDPWFKEYPATYAEQGLQRFYAGEAPAARAEIPLPEEGGAVAFRVIRPVDVGQKILGLALNPNVQQKQKQIVDETRSLVDKRLDPYQTNPTPHADPYWSFTR